MTTDEIQNPDDNDDDGPERDVVAADGVVVPTEVEVKVFPAPADREDVGTEGSPVLFLAALTRRT
jgi:hypothetical protein